MDIDHAQLHGLIQALAEEAPCPICGKNEWDIVLRAVHLPWYDEPAAPPLTEGDEGFVAIPLTCLHCAHMRFFAAYRLMAIAAKHDAKGNGHV